MNLNASVDRVVTIVDDDKSFRDALQSLLRSLGFKVTTFASARDFLCSDQKDPGCLILDFLMYGMSGLELQAELKTTGRDVPIIFITAHADDETHRRAVEAGALACLPKPFQEQKLMAALGAAFDRQIPHHTTL